MAKNAGQFQPGNPGGPGRPRRAVEADYLRAFSEALSLEEWKEIVARAVYDAVNGDGKAREWLTRYALGDGKPGALLELAALEYVGADVEDTVAAAAEDLTGPSWATTLTTPGQRAAEIANRRRKAAG